MCVGWGRSGEAGFSYIVPVGQLLQNITVMIIYHFQSHSWSW